MEKFADACGTKKPLLRFQEAAQFSGDALLTYEQPNTKYGRLLLDVTSNSSCKNLMLEGMQSPILDNFTTFFNHLNFKIKLVMNTPCK